MSTRQQGLIRFILASVYVSILLAPATMNAFDIVKDGKPVVTVVVPMFTKEQKDTDQRWTEMAANWFTTYVKKATGADVKVVTEGVPVEGNVVSIGHTKLAEAAGITMDVKKLESKSRFKSKKADITITPEERAQFGNMCRLVVKDNTFYLIGRDKYGAADYTIPGEEKPRRVNMTCIGAKGTCQAVAEFLRNYVGCRWYIPTPQGEYIPATNNIAIPDSLDRTVTPVFASTGGAFWSGPYDDLHSPKSPCQMANNFWPGVLKRINPHFWNQGVPVWKYGKDHPEYFALIDGKRRVTEDRFGNSYLCTSNPEVRALLLNEIRAMFDKGFEWVQLGQADGFRRCQCPECEKLDNYRDIDDPDNPCERVLLLHKYIIDECKKSHPDKKVQLLAYGPTTWPSRKFDQFGDNVIAEVCNDTTLPLWKPKVWASTVYVYFWGTYHKTGIGPKLSPKTLAQKIRLFRDNNVLGIFFDGGGEDWGLEGPAYYTVGQLLGNPDINPDDCVKDYCQFVYGKASSAMIQFFNLLYGRLEMNPMNAPETVFPALFPPQVLQKLDYLLGKAEREADSERAKGWLKLTRVCFDYLRLNSEMFMLYHAYQVRKDLPSINALRDSVTRWKAYRQKFLDMGKDKDYVSNWYPVWNRVENYFKAQDDSYAGCGQIVKREPLTLDFDALAKNLTSKSAGPARMVVARVLAAVNLDAGLNAEAWTNATPYSLSGLNGTATTANTRVRALFDDKNLYLSFECEEPEVDNMKLKEDKRDGGIWNNDCLDILLDPATTQSRYYHLIASPREGSFYDAKFGFINDPLNPMMGKEDTTWNPDWKYSFKIDAPAKKWTMVVRIPFTALEVEAPKAGACWAVNFGRERYAGKSEEFSIWSPNDFGTGFCEPAAFGQLYFEKGPEK